jgi:carboxylesterase type B
MLDIVAALERVRDNIERFGGDPNLATIFGPGAREAGRRAAFAVRAHKNQSQQPVVALVGPNCPIKALADNRKDAHRDREYRASTS